MIDIRTLNDSSRSRLPLKTLSDAAGRAFAGEGKSTVSVLIILSDNKKVRELGKEYLGHDYDTDVITFDLSEEDSDAIEGEIYIGTEQAEWQAKEFGVSMTCELKRLAVHGALHLAGYDDQTPEERERMHELENKYL